MKNKQIYLITLLLFSSSYLIFSTNIQNQGIYIDENFHHTFGMTYYDLLQSGDFTGPCMTGLGECPIINYECIGEMQWIGSGGIVKGLLVGLGDDLFSNNERIYYASVEPCRPIHKNLEIPGINIPTQSELTSARLFSPIFASLGVVVSFLIGNFLFNKFVGISFAIMLLFHSLWMLHSRIITSEIYVNFFMILSVFILLYALNSEKKIKFKFLILSAIIFAIAINTKLSILEIIPFMIVSIFLRNSLHENWNLQKLKNKNFILNSFAISSIFLSLIIVTVFLTFPFYYLDPVGQFLSQIEAIENYGGVNEPWSFSNRVPLQFGFTFSATIFPIFDTYFYLFLPENIPTSATWGHTFTTIPLTLFFLIGISYLFLKIKRQILSNLEFLMLIWYLTTFIIISLSVDSYNSTRHFIPLFFPMMLISSYGLWHFLRKFQSSILKIGFFILTMFTHSLTYLVFWERIYFEPSLIWILPLDINLRDSLSVPIVLFSGIIFLISFFILYFIKRTSLYKKI